MKVKKLIEELQKYNKEADIKLAYYCDSQGSYSLIKDFEILKFNNYQWYEDYFLVLS